MGVEVNCRIVENFPQGVMDETTFPLTFCKKHDVTVMSWTIC